MCVVMRNVYDAWWLRARGGDNGVDTAWWLRAAVKPGKSKTQKRCAVVDPAHVTQETTMSTTKKRGRPSTKKAAQVSSHTLLFASLKPAVAT